jgi:hypothetical protein
LVFVDRGGFGRGGRSQEGCTEWEGEIEEGWELYEGDGVFVERGRDVERERKRKISPEGSIKAGGQEMRLMEQQKSPRKLDVWLGDVAGSLNLSHVRGEISDAETETETYKTTWWKCIY